MSIGVILDSSCILAGGLVGAAIRNKVPERIKEPLNTIFGIAAIAIGIVSFMKLESLPAVIMALILGTVIGELLNLDNKVKKLFHKIISRFNFKIEGEREPYVDFFVVVAVTFCASGTNIFGALYEGATGDFTILLSKAVMDVFAAMIFAVVLGYAMSVIVIPQFIFLTLIFYLGRVLMPLLEQSVLNDFMAVGGLMTFALGLVIAKIKKINAVNLLPALLVIFPVSYIFHLLF